MWSILTLLVLYLSAFTFFTTGGKLAGVSDQSRVTRVGLSLSDSGILMWKFLFVFLFDCCSFESIPVFSIFCFYPVFRANQTADWSYSQTGIPQ